MRYSSFLTEQVMRGFNRGALRYDAVARVQRAVADALLGRLGDVRVQPQSILDLGVGTGYCLSRLQRRYPRALCTGVDIAENMLLSLRTSRQGILGRRKPHQLLCADAAALPLKEASMHLVFSSLMLQWCGHLGTVFSEIYRVLMPEGFVMFSTLGPDTLSELRASWAMVDAEVHVHDFLDIPAVATQMISAGFSDPVLDCETITLQYRDAYRLMSDLRELGASNVDSRRRRGLMGKQRFRAVLEAYEQYRTPEGFLPVTYEVIYGHAWKRKRSSTQVDTQRLIPMRYGGNRA